MPLHFKVLAIALGFLLHAGDTLGQAVQAGGSLMLALVALLLMLVHGAQQAFEAAFKHMLEAVQIRRALDTALQAIDLLTQLIVHGSGRRAVVGMAVTGALQMALEGFQAFVELLEIDFELMLTAVGDGQHQHGQIIQDGYQFVPVQPMLQAFAHGLRLRLVTFWQAEVIEHPQQGFLDVRCNRAVGRLNPIGQGVVGLLVASVWLVRISASYRQRLSFRCTRCELHDGEFGWITHHCMIEHDRLVCLSQGKSGQIKRLISGLSSCLCRQALQFIDVHRAGHCTLCGRRTQLR
ncbi:hypothetical protein D3C81_1121990 [compost metagenome]